jgi:hypothetical protein
MMLSEEIQDAGMSPDAVYRDDDGVIVGGLEVKNPTSKVHIEYCIKGEVPTKYWDQVLCPFVLSDQIKWWVFMSYDYRNYTRPVFFVKVTRESVDKEVKERRKKLMSFLQMVDEKHFELSTDPKAGEVITKGQTDD